MFAHPEILKQNPKRVSYYRMLAMVSQKSMARVGISVKKYEEGKSSIDDNTALKISTHLNKIISVLIEHDETIDERELDLWRGMAAGSQAQGSWQNIKGDRAEVVIKELIERKIREQKLILKETFHGKAIIQNLRDGRLVIMGNEPDIGIYKDNTIQVAIEIKGGIDSAGVLERFGAALKSLRRAKQENPKAVTILIMQGISLTSKAKEEIKSSKRIINHFFTIEDIIENANTRSNLLNILKLC